MHNGNTKATLQQGEHAPYCHLIAAQQEPYNTTGPLMKNLEFSEEKQQQENEPLADLYVIIYDSQNNINMTNIIRKNKTKRHVKLNKKYNHSTKWGKKK